MPCNKIRSGDFGYTKLLYSMLHIIAGYPLDKVLGILPTKSLAGVPLLGAGFVPPVSVAAVAKAAVTAATDPSVEAGILDVWQIKAYESP
jgi:hypothetical protein